MAGLRVLRSRAGYDPGRKPVTKVSDFSGHGDPQILALPKHMIQSPPQCLHAERLADDEWMYNDVEDEWVFRRTPQHFLKLIYNHFLEFPAGMLPKDQSRAVIDFYRIRDRKDGPRARAHPKRLVVGWPIHNVLIPSLLQEVERVHALRKIRTKPASWRFAGVLRQSCGALVDETGFVLFPQLVLAFRVGAAMPDVLVAPLVEAFDDFGASVQRRRINIVRAGQLIFIQKIEITPNANTITIVAPGEVALRLRRVRRRAVAAETSLERKMLDIIAESECKPCAIWPRVLRSFVDRAVLVALMLGKFHVVLQLEMSRGGRRRRDVLIFDVLIAITIVARRRSRLRILQTSIDFRRRGGMLAC
jgi:hypothetical protein